jgi:hypothetical protein
VNSPWAGGVLDGRNAADARSQAQADRHYRHQLANSRVARPPSKAIPGSGSPLPPAMAATER